MKASVVCRFNQPGNQSAVSSEWITDSNSAFLGSYEPNENTYQVISDRAGCVEGTRSPPNENTFMGLETGRFPQDLQRIRRSLLTRLN